MEYQNDIVENLLRNYYSLNTTDDLVLRDYKIDLDIALAKLKEYSGVLYLTIVNVFVNGMPIQEQAKLDDVSRMQVNRRLHDALHVLTMIMNGEVL
jgi:hypothetical protein